jgi:predicted permease
MVGRLAPGTSRERAAAELASIAESLAAAHPTNRGWGVRVLPLEEWLVGPQARRASALLLGAVVLLLVLACTNVASLLLARSTTRQTETSVRLALGASRSRLARQLLAEAVSIAALGGSLGLVIAAWALAAARRLSGIVPRIEDAGLDARVAVFAASTALLTSALVGILPALSASRTALAGGLAQSARTGGTPRQQRLREALVIGQLALAIVLMLGAGLMVRSLLRLQDVDPGFDTAAVLAAPLQLTTAAYAEPWQKVLFYERVLARIAAIPGVAAAGGTSVQPFSDWNTANYVTPEERAARTSPSGFMLAAWRAVTTGYFAAAGVPILRGRVFTAEDRYDGPQVAVVSQSLAARLWPGEDPIGRRLFWGGTSGTPWTVIGVVGDIRDVDPAAELLPTLFLTTRQLAWPHLTLLVRARGPLPGLAEAVRRAVWSEDPSLAVPEVVPVADGRAASLAERRFQAATLGAFAGAALLLSAFGLYGVLAYAVARRRREIGIRMALGARASVVTAMLVRHGLLLTGAGVAVGLLASLALHRVVEGALFETAGTDPPTYLAATLLLLAVGLLATAVPARRAARTSPQVALRE